MKIINSNKMKFYILNTLIFAIIFLQLVTPSFSSLTFLKNISKINILDNNKAANFSNEKFSKEKSQELSGFSQFIKSFVLNFFSLNTYVCVSSLFNRLLFSSLRKMILNRHLPCRRQSTCRVLLPHICESCSFINSKII